MKTATLVYKAPMEGDVDGWHSVRITYDSGYEYKVDWSDRVQREFHITGIGSLDEGDALPMLIQWLQRNYEDPRTQLSQVPGTNETN